MVFYKNFNFNGDLSEEEIKSVVGRALNMAIESLSRNTIYGLNHLEDSSGKIVFKEFYSKVSSISLNEDFQLIISFQSGETVIFKGVTYSSVTSDPKILTT